MSAPFTPGPWMVPHFAQDDVACSCGYVLSESQHGMGSIATVHHQLDGDDCNEPLDIAKANARLIAEAPNTFELVESILRSGCALPYSWKLEARAVIERVKGGAA